MRVSFTDLMQRSTSLFMFVLALLFGARAVHADPVRWDSRGWVMLGERTVNGRYDTDEIPVGIRDGKFNRLTVVVEDSDLELLEMVIHFADGTLFSPNVKGLYSTSSRTRVVDLPPGEKFIHSINFRYKNVPGDRRNARVQVWAFKTGNNAPPPPPRRYQWDTTGWVLLGEKTVDYTYNGTADHDRIDVGAYEGRFSKLQMVVDDADMDLQTFRIEFADRTEYKPQLHYKFTEGARTREIQLPPGEQLIRKIDLRYTPASAGRARVQVWGFKLATATPPPPRPFTWDNNGWVMLGEQTVDGHRHADRDTIRVGRQEGKFGKLTIVVHDADLEMLEMVVHLRHGREFRPQMNFFFRENTRTRVIDLPGDRDRTIESIDFKYRNLPGEGRARVQVWAK